jgi:hypothetical protein
MYKKKSKLTFHSKVIGSTCNDHKYDECKNSSATELK